MISLPSFLKPVSLIAALSLTAVACSDGPGSASDLQEIIALSGNAEQAECIADATFDKYGADEEAWKTISEADAEGFKSLVDGGAKDKVVGFKDFFEGTVSDCLAPKPQ